MNKTIKILFSLLIMAALVMTGCNVGSFSPEIGGEDDVIASIATNTNGLSTTNLVVGTATGTLSNTTGQVITITFTGIVDVSGTTIPGLSITNMGTITGATAGVAKSQGSALTYTAEVFQTGANSSTAYLTLDCTSATSWIELIIDAGSVTGNGGTIHLSSGDDEIPGEDEDDYIKEFAVTGGTPVTNDGTVRDPDATVTITPLAMGVNEITTTVTDTVNTHDFALATLSSAVSVYSFSNGAYTLFTHTPAFNTTTGVYSIPATTTGNQLYKIYWNEYDIVENAAKNGYFHRVSFDQLDDDNLSDNSAILSVGTFRSFNNSAQSFAGQPTITIDSNGGYINMAQITAANVSVKVFVDTGNDGQIDNPNSDWVYDVDFTVRKVDDDTFMLYLPAEIGIDGDWSYVVTIQPVIQDLGATYPTTPADTTDDYMHVSTTSEDGAFVLTGNF